MVVSVDVPQNGLSEDVKDRVLDMLLLFQELNEREIAVFDGDFVAGHMSNYAQF